MYHFYLIQNHLTVKDSVRMQIWKKLLRVDSRTENYQALLKSLDEKGLPFMVESVIQADIDRSLHNHKDLDPKVPPKILFTH